jgi:hypothetical protein
MRKFSVYLVMLPALLFAGYTRAQNLGASAALWITGSGAPSLTCSATSYNGVFYTSAALGLYQCSKVTGSYGWNAVGGSGISGATAGQALIAGSATTATSSKALAGTGAGITTGPTTTTLGDCAKFVDTSGTLADTGSPCGSGGGGGGAETAFTDDFLTQGVSVSVGTPGSVQGCGGSMSWGLDGADASCYSPNGAIATLSSEPGINGFWDLYSNLNGNSFGVLIAWGSLTEYITSSANLTAAAKVKVVTSTVGRYLFGFGSALGSPNSGPQFGFTVDPVANGNSHWFYGSGNLGGSGWTDSGLGSSAWHTLQISLTGLTATFYIDGTSVGTSTVTADTYGMQFVVWNPAGASSGVDLRIDWAGIQSTAVLPGGGGSGGTAGVSSITPGGTNVTCTPLSNGSCAGAVTINVSGGGGGGFTQIGQVVVGSGGQPTIEFGSIPSTFTNLKLVMSLVTGYYSHGGIQLNFNHDATTDYDTQLLLANTAAGIVQQGGTNYTNATIGYYGVNNLPAVSETTIYSYAQTATAGRAFTTLNSSNWTEGGVIVISAGGEWRNTAAITDIVVSLSGAPSDQFQQNSVATLYGMQ